ncbi:F0F1 ATP synthase subunit [Methanosarcina sp. MSH10X1]|nr:F0F1 ATP synthase subunit [Methanosarcina sp. MSH10X1]
MAEKPLKEEPRLARQVGEKAERKLRAQRQVNRTVWLGLGMMGLVGWSVAVPTLLGVLIGLWLDEHYPVSYSWTLTMLIIGLFIGCLNAWYWVTREHREMQLNQEDNNE